MLKQAIRSALAAAGYELRRVPEPLRLLKHYDIQTVLDVGANDGAFARRIRRLLPGAAIHCFEPLPNVYKRLQAVTSQIGRANSWQVALGEVSGTVPMYQNEFSQSSSLLEMTQVLTEAYPFARRASLIEVQCDTLDRWAESQQLEPNFFLKLDVQGFEDRVIRGANRVLEQTAVVFTEVSFEELYVGQPLFSDIAPLLEFRGFQFHGMVAPAFDSRSSKLLQGDAFFVRSDRVSTKNDR